MPSADRSSPSSGVSASQPLLILFANLAADNGDAPSVAEIGATSIDLYTGSVNQQTFLQNLAASVDVSKTSEITSTIDPSVGETGPYYFVRFRSLNLKDDKNPQYNYQAYSAKFE